MSEALPDFGHRKVVVAGDVMLDRFWSGDAQRVSPEAPVPVVHVARREDRAGGAGNVAINLASLGCSAVVVGVVGKDAEGAALKALLEAAGVSAQLVQASDHPTIVKLRVLSRHQQLLRMDFEQAFSGQPCNALMRVFAEQIQGADAVALSDYFKGSLTHCAALIEQASAQQLPVLIDPKGVDWGRYRGATLLTPNQAEFEQVVGPVRDSAEIETKARQLIEQLDLQGLLVTRGEQGMMVIPARAKAMSLGTQAKDVFDVTGAGDTVIATLAAALAARVDWYQAAALANAAAGIVVGKLGTASVNPSELRRALQRQPGDGTGVLNRGELLQAADQARLAGERVVMTNGCFDLLHAGHVSYLRELASLGDRLIVAVNDDDSVRRLKGEDRPLNPLADRMAVLAALDCVDWVVPFSEDTPEQLIAAVLPDVLAKGGDYQPQDIAGHDAVVAAGGEVRVLGFLPGRSTSSMIERIRSRDE